MDISPEYKCMLNMEIEYRNKGDEYALWLIEQHKDMCEIIESYEEDTTLLDFKEKMSHHIEKLHSDASNAHDDLINAIETVNERLVE